MIRFCFTLNRKLMLLWAVLCTGMLLLPACEKSQAEEVSGTPTDTGDDIPDETDTVPTDTGKKDTGTGRDTAPKDTGRSTETDTCANLDLSLERQPATIMLVIDHSASMDLQMGDTDTRWSVLVYTLMGTVDNPEKGLVWNLEQRVNFGMVLFTAKRNQPETCPMLQTVAPALNNGDEIGDIFKADDETYKGASPVPAGIDAAVQLLKEMEGPSKKVMLLATDGDPQTCDNLAVNDDAAAQDVTVKAVQDAYAAGITTFVIGLDDATDEPAAAYLQQVANAGIGLDPNDSEKAEFHQGLTESSLVDAITNVIVEEAQSCVYELNGKGVAEGQESKGTVTLDGKELELNNTEYGWRLKSSSEIELLGGACDDIQLGEHQLTADFPCEAIVIIVE